MVRHGEGGLSIFIGLNGTKEDLGLKADNYWIFADNNFDELYVPVLTPVTVEPNAGSGVWDQKNFGCEDVQL